jgi:beta-glucosidase
VGQLPVYYYRRPSARRGYLLSSAEPLYPFGFGLSYTSFAHGAPTVSPAQIGPDGVSHISVRVTNTGNRPGTDVVELYVSDRVASVTRPVRRLRDFVRVALAPGESRDVVFEIGADDFEFYDLEMKRGVEPGWFDIEIGTSSESLSKVGLEVVR